MKFLLFQLGVLAAMLAAPFYAVAEASPRLIHSPVGTARAGEPLRIHVRTLHDGEVDAWKILARTAGSVEWQEYRLAHNEAGELDATLPGDLIQPPGVEYVVQTVSADGKTRHHMGQPEAPHRVNVVGVSAKMRAFRQLEAYGGQRSNFTLRSEMSIFGARLSEGQPTDDFSDRYWLTEAEYVYRPLNLIHDFRFGFGVMRGAVPEVDETPILNRDDPGANYGFGEVNVALGRHLTVGARLLLGATAEGFASGAGTRVRLGDLAGTHVDVRYDRLGDVGQRTDLRFHWTTLPTVPMALGVEFTDWPIEEGTGATRLSYDVGLRWGEGYLVSARVGVANRDNSLETGYMGGLSFSKGF